MGRLQITWQHIRRSPYQALAAILVMLLTTFVACVFLMLAFGSEKILSYFESRPQVTAFLKDSTTKDQAGGIMQKLEETNKTASVKYISKEDALNIYKQQNKNDPLLLEMVSASILPASIEVSAKEIGDLNSLSDILKKETGVDEVVFQKDVVDTLVRWTTALRTIGVVFIAFLAAMATLVILTIIGMRISSRKEEIEIMRLVGASSWYIRWPFIFEGMFYGAMGAVFAWALSYGLLYYATPHLSIFLSGIGILPVSPILMLELLGVVLTGALLVGIFASTIALWRYLKN
ncbi:MAG: ABC transporter permease [Patescibacteria group bacterium]|nr:ABC transporter permease [Patescibacteria group bacterium]